MSNVEEVLIALRRVIRATDMHSRQLVKSTGLTSPQIVLMQAIQQAKELTIGEAAQRVNLSQATVTSILDRLEKRDLVYRIRSVSDKRKVYVSLTPTGLETLFNAPLPLQSSFVNQFEALKDWEQHMILSALQRIAHMMDAEQIDASPYLEVGDIDREHDLL
jgi:DNA-binding MarR family transcriptional regulator